VRFIGPFFLNGVKPFAVGLPLLLAWLVLSFPAALDLKARIYEANRENRTPGDPR
jgi:hypothetical protein